MAEYNGHQIEFTIEFNNGSKVQGYNYLAIVYQKDQTLNYQEFLEQNHELLLNGQNNENELFYFQHRIKYTHFEYDDNQKFICTLTNKKSIDKTEIKSIQINEMISQPYTIGISTVHHWKDRLWMNKNPIEKISIGGFLCVHQIFIHETNPEVELLKNEIQTISTNYDREIKEQQRIMENSDGERYYQAQNKINELEKNIDVQLSELLQKFKGLKVVIVSSCTG
jgi:hypothetical protein